MLTNPKAHRLGVIITIATAIVFGAWPAMGRGFYNDGGNAVYLLLWAQIARVLPMLAICWRQKIPLFTTYEDRRQAIIGGVMQAASTSLTVAAVQFLPGALVIVIMFTHTLMLLFYLAWRGETQLNRWIVLTTVAALIGLTFVLDIWDLAPNVSLLGMAMSFGSAIMVASRLYIYGHQTQRKHPAAVGAENFLIANLCMPLLLFFDMPHGAATWHGDLWAFGSCIVLAAGTLGQFYAIKLLGSFRFSLLLKLEPLFTTFFSAWLVAELLKPVQYIGILIVVGSLALYQVIDHRRVRLESSPA